MSRVRRLALLLIGLGLVATTGVGLWPPLWTGPARMGLLLGLPFVVGVLSTLLLPRSPRRLGQSARVRGTSRFHLVIAAGLALDLGAIVLAARLGLASIETVASPLPGWRIAAFFVVLPLTIAVATLGLEWALHARIWSYGRRQGAPRESVGWALAAGVALAVPALAPALGPPVAAAFAACALGVVLAREITLLLLFRAGGLFVAGAYRGTLLAVDALGLGLAASFYRPAFVALARSPEFFLVRFGGAVLALLLVAVVVRRDTPSDVS